MSRRLISSYLAVLALVLTLAGCSRMPTPAAAPSLAPDPAALPDGAIVDGHQLGQLLDCSTGCEDVLSFAESSAVDTRGLDPSAITDVHVYIPFVPAGMTATGGGHVVVYDLAGGLPIAIRVHCGVGDCQVVEPQPIFVEPPIDYSCKGSECIQCQGSVCTPWVPPSLEAEPTPSGIPEGVG